MQEGTSLARLPVENDIERRLILSFRYQEQKALAIRCSLLSRAAEAEKSEARPSIVGMWTFQLVSQGNTAHNPSIPDGAVIDFGYNQIHCDGTEIINSGGHAAETHLQVHSLSTSTIRKETTSTTSEETS